MKKQLLANLITGFIVSTITTSAMASLSIPNGWYLEGNIGSTKLSEQDTNGKLSTHGLGYNANAGYKFMPYLATEIGYTQYADSTIKDQFNNKAANNKHYSYDLAAKGIVPIVASGLEVFAKLGIQRTVSTMSIDSATAVSNINLNTARHSNTGLLIGAGAQYYMMPELAGVLQWVRAKNNSETGTMDLFSIGLSIIFE